MINRGRSVKDQVRLGTAARRGPAPGSCSIPGMYWASLRHTASRMEETEIRP